MRERPTRVVYVLGGVHSGSTLLGLLLARHPAIEAPGELRTLVDAWRRGHFCSCGLRVRECAFWTAVVREWLQRSRLESVEVYEGLRQRAESVRCLPMLVLRTRRPSPPFQRYLEATASLFATIASLSGRPVVVDTSKTAARACTLNLVPEVDVRLVHLVRDPRGVCFSMTKPRAEDLAAGVPSTRGPQPVRRTAARWILRNVIAAWVRRRHDPARSVLVRYEDLVADLSGTLGRIAAAIDVDLGEVIRGVRQGEAIETRHVATGNRLRMAKAIQFRFDDEWTRAMPARDRRLAETLTAPWRRAYGYD